MSMLLVSYLQIAIFQNFKLARKTILSTFFPVLETAQPVVSLFSEISIKRT